MRGRLLALVATLGLVFGSASAMAQAPTGDIVGRVVDSSGAVLPGVVVTVSGGALIQPQSATTGDTGTYLFPGLQPGDTYTVKFELTGFRTLIVERVAVSVGGNTNRVPAGTTLSNNYQFQVAGAQVGPDRDPLFRDAQSGDYTPTADVGGAGSRLTSVAQLLARP